MRNALLVLAVCVVLGALLFGSCAYFMASPDNPLTGALQDLQREGRAFGESTDQRGCERESKERQLACDDLRCRLAAAMFTGGCFQTARPTPGFCHGVPAPDGFPGPGEIRALTAWREKRCEGLAGGEFQACVQVAQGVSQACMAQSYEEQFRRDDDERQADAER